MRDHDHLTASEYHRQLAEVLAGSEAGHPWACVMAFYSAFHVLRWALRRDPRFDDISALRKVHKDLTPDDRHTERHQARGRPGGRVGFGLNQLVGLFYPDASRAYVKLHEASVEVRYKRIDLAVLPDATRLLALLDEVCAVLTPAIVNSKGARH